MPAAIWRRQYAGDPYDANNSICGGDSVAPHFAFAQTVTSDPQLLAVAKQQLMVQQQQLVVLNVIEALEQTHVSPATASAALAYAQQKGQQQARDEQALQEAQTAAASPQ